MKQLSNDLFKNTFLKYLIPIILSNNISSDYISYLLLSFSNKILRFIFT